VTDGIGHPASPHDRGGDDAALLVAAARGSEPALEAFYRRWWPAVIRFHLRRTGDREAAHELAAETFATVIMRCGDYDPDRGAARGWLFTIALHKLLDSIRRTGRDEALRRRLAAERSTHIDGHLDALLERSAHPRIRELLDDLPAEQRLAIQARVLDERPYLAIARQQGCSEAVVRQRVHRGLRRMRDRLDEAA